MPQRALLIELRLLADRYHGDRDWPPSPFRLFQALVAGAYGGRWRSEPEDDKDAAFRWLERLPPPLVAAPPKRELRATTYFVPNNDLDAVGGDPRRVSEIRAGKVVRPVLFDAGEPILYAWPFDDGEDHARRLCALAERLHTCGAGIDAAFARAEVVDWNAAEAGLAAGRGRLARPAGPGSATAPTCPMDGSLDSVKARFEATRERFRRETEGRSTVTLFRQPPKPRCRTVAYDRPPVRLLFDLRPADGSRPYRPVAAERAAEVAAAIRDCAARRLRQAFPARLGEVDRVVVGSDAGAADLSRRVRFIPLPSIGMAHTDPAIRRILVEVPPDCPFTGEEIAWAVSGQSPVDSITGEVADDTIYAPAEDLSMLRHYGVGETARRWQSVTPVVLPERRRRGRLDGGGRAADESRAAAAVAGAVRHAGLDWRGLDIRIQREPFRAKGDRAEAFLPQDEAMRARFAGRLCHVEIAFPKPVSGPLVIGDGRFLGLGLLAPVREEKAPGVHLFAIDSPGALPPASSAEAVARALRRAVMARAAATAVKPRGRGSEPLTLFFSGHEADGGAARPGKHNHLFFLAEDSNRDGRLDRLAVIAPDIADRSERPPEERREIAGHLPVLESALRDFAELRAGHAGILTLAPVADAPDDNDRTFGRSRRGVSRTDYRPTRHAHRVTLEEAVRLDLIAECARRGLPRPEVKVLAVEHGRRGGLSARARLRFRTAVAGPILLGRGSHFGAGLFETER
jgi:CRISPR-associated protein Csb2